MKLTRKDNEAATSCKAYRKLILMFMLMMIPRLVTAETVVFERDFTSLFKGFEGTIVIKHGDSCIIHNKARSTARFTPFSTFKIPNSVIALETGIIKHIDSAFQWDTTKYLSQDWWPTEWKLRHSLRTAIKYSVVPFYREIASRVGEQRMSEFVKKFNYGNMDISSGVDSFWLGGSIAISAMEQVDFLKKFFDNKLGVKESTTKLVKEILIQEKGDGYTLSAKTGGGGGFLKNDTSRALGWYVGYVEKGDRVNFFALNIEGKSTAAIKNVRVEITKAVLKELGIL